MGYTPTLIGKLAMGHLGDRDIADIDDLFDQDAQVLKARYDHARDLAYVSHDWKWAKDSVQLQQSVTAPAVRYDYAYALPNNFARISNVSEFVNMEPQLDENGWDISGGRLIANAGYVFIDYVRNDWSEAVWPSYFADCVALKLAELACLKITNSNELKQGLVKMFAQTILPQARSVDSTSQPARRHIVASPWQRSRFGRASGSNLRRT